MTCGYAVPPVKLLVDGAGHYLLLDGTVTGAFKLDVDIAGNNLEIDGSQQTHLLDIDTLGNNLDIDQAGNSLGLNFGGGAGSGFDMLISAGGVTGGSGSDLLINNGFDIPFAPIATIYGDYFKPDATVPTP